MGGIGLGCSATLAVAEKRKMARTLGTAAIHGSCMVAPRLPARVVTGALSALAQKTSDCCGLSRCGTLSWNALDRSRAPCHAAICDAENGCTCRSCDRAGQVGTLVVAEVSSKQSCFHSGREQHPRFA